MSNDVPAVNAAIRILERIAADAPNAVSPGALASELGLNRSTCYNILATLQRGGWATSLGHRNGWTLGPGLLALTGVSQESIHAVVQDEIDALSRQLRFVVFAVQQDGTGGYTVIAAADPRRGVRVTVDVGDRFEFSAPAIMHAFYAYRDFDEFASTVRARGLEQFTECTVVDLEELHEVFARVRECGYSRSLQQYSLAQSGVAASVFDRKGLPTLVLATLAFSSELTASNVAEVGQRMAATAERITERTGGMLPAQIADTADTEQETA